MRAWLKVVGCGVLRVVEAVYEGGVLRLLEDVGLRDGERVRVLILGGSFYDLVERVEFESKEDVDRVVCEVRGRAEENS